MCASSQLSVLLERCNNVYNSNGCLYTYINLEAQMSYAFRISKIHIKQLLLHDSNKFLPHSLLHSNANFYYHSVLKNKVVKTNKKYK